MQFFQQYKVVKPCGIDHVQYKGSGDEVIDITDMRGSLYCALANRLVEGVKGTEIGCPDANEPPPASDVPKPVSASASKKG